MLEALFVCFLLSLYTEVPLVLSSESASSLFPGVLIIPSFVTVLILVPLLGTILWNTIYKYEVKFVFAIFAVLCLSAVASPGINFVDQKILGMIQTVVSITAGVILVALSDRLDAKRIARIFCVLTVIIVAGSVLEVLGVLRAVSDAFRNVAYTQVGLDIFYDADARDIGITGFPRPKLFTAEPSHVSKGFLVFANCWLLLAYRRRNVVAVLLMTFAMFVMMGSPVILLSGMASIALVLFSERRVVRAVPVALILLLVASATLLLFPTVVENIVGRFQQTLDVGFANESLLASDSIGLRLVLPAIALVDVLRGSPLFGVGISGKEVIEDFYRVPVSSLTAVGNSFATYFMYLGVVGATLFAFAFRTYLRRSKIDQILLLIVMIVALSMSMGGFETPRFWGYIFIFVAAMKKRSQLRRTIFTNASQGILGEARRIVVSK